MSTPHDGGEGPVFDAEVLTDEENAEVARRFAETEAGAGAVVRRQPGEIVRHRVEMARRAVGAAWCSDQMVRARSVAAYRARQAPRDLARLMRFAIRGHVRWIGKAWTFLTYGDLRADARVARLAGDAEARRAAQELIRADSRARWARLAMAVERVGAAAGVAAVAALVLWLLDSVMTRDEMWPWLAGLYTILAAAGSMAVAAAPIIATLALLSWLVAAAFEGRDKTPAPAGWYVPIGTTPTRGSTSG